MPALGGPELLIVLFLVLVIFGAGKVPSVMSDLGKGVREMRESMSDINGEEKPRGNS